MKRVSLFLFAFLLLLSVFPAGVWAADEKPSLLEAVDDLIGTPYKYGGTTTKGFDCSGFVTYLFKKYDISLPRSSRDMAKAGEKVEKADLQYGDLVFFNTNGKSISHVGVYIGDGEFAHSSTSSGVVITSLDDKYYKKRYVTARRMAGDKNYEQLISEVNEDVEEQIDHENDPAA